MATEVAAPATRMDLTPEMEQQQQQRNLGHRRTMSQPVGNPLLGATADGGMLAQWDGASVVRPSVGIIARVHSAQPQEGWPMRGLAVDAAPRPSRPTAPLAPPEVAGGAGVHGSTSPTSSAVRSSEVRVLATTPLHLSRPPSISELSLHVCSHAGDAVLHAGFEGSMDIKPALGKKGGPPPTAALAALVAGDPLVGPDAAQAALLDPKRAKRILANRCVFPALAPLAPVAHWLASQHGWAEAGDMGRMTGNQQRGTRSVNCGTSPNWSGAWLYYNRRQAPCRINTKRCTRPSASWGKSAPRSPPSSSAPRRSVIWPFRSA
jgi:hypothetical protein